MHTPATYRERDQRLVILRVLRAQAAYQANDSAIKQALASVGHLLPRDQVRELLRYLRGETLIAINELQAPDSETDKTIWICTLTERGSDVALGITTHPGVNRPSPRP